MSNLVKEFSVTDSTKVSISDFLFRNLGIDSSIYGAGIHVQNSNITVYNSEFSNNSASYRKGLALLWVRTNFESIKSQIQSLIIMEVIEVDVYFTIFTVQLYKTLLLSITLLLMGLILLAMLSKSSWVTVLRMI